MVDEEVSIGGESIDVTPHPRLLAVLGDIEFAPWQCLAELIDNAFDDFLSDPPEDDTPTVTISLPSRDSDHRDAQVWISDNGRGMSLDHLNMALSAGWSSNARYGKLGLFGMGFNIATARLGNTTQVRTTRAGDSEWVSVTLDLRKMATQDNFVVPVIREPKDDPAEHGTQVIVSDLKQEQHDLLSRQQTKIRDLLGDVYSFLLRERDFSLRVDGKSVQPLLPCIWNKDRSVVQRGVKYPAYIEIDKELPSLNACHDCGRWQDLTVRECEECGSTELEERERRITGWLGIQRYSHKSDFGIDFLRNGRKILVRDVRIFAWEDPNELGARPESEYPIEVPNEGRIVGEIHIDHVRVNYQKNAFEYNTIEWKQVVRTLRGDGPLRPNIAREAGYPTNESPIGRLFTGYRRLDPGLKYLVPGDGDHAIHEKAREWAKLFRKGDPAYQHDHIWYEQAKQHDEPKVIVPPESTDPGDAGDDDARSRLDIPEPTDSQPQPGDPTPPRETEDQKQERYREQGEVLHDISGEYALPGFGNALKVTVYGLNGTEVADTSGQRVPVYVQQQRGTDVHVFVDFGHSLFTDFGADPREYAVLGVAEHIRDRRGSNQALSSIIADLMDRCLPDQKVTPTALGGAAHSLLDRVRRTMRPVISGNSEGFWGYVMEPEHAAAEQRFAQEGMDADWQEARESGAWILYASSAAISRLIQQRPGEFLDGRVFRAPYQTFTDSHARALTVNRLIGYLNDAGQLAEHQTRRRPDELNRGRLSCRLLEAELVDAPEDSS
ncbi:ATP-binding protein [Nocardioides gansuensis]|uniref:ATP-binding protein n=1 Tax=Nocardioides gansuensis TaxID=2138300 RepID=A0A2T8F8T9_9ACTN|nr:ATP-binding protein [Nocardioides gansuensis]PVG82103.1 ATP-binding protein [Nocardioides gansuensis]